MKMMSLKFNVSLMMITDITRDKAEISIEEYAGT